MRNDGGMHEIKRDLKSHCYQCLCSLFAKGAGLEYSNAVAVQEVVRQLHLRERMSALTAAISIDFDCFSQRSHRAERLSNLTTLHCRLGRL